MNNLLVLDVESLGLHGVGYAWGAVLIKGDAVAVRALHWCPLEVVYSDAHHRQWAERNVLPKLAEATGQPTVRNARELRDEFWALWRQARSVGAQVYGDQVWPVEANFLSACILDERTRYWDGPDPLLDATTLRNAGLIPHCEDTHQPLEDAWNTWLSMRDWWLRQH